MHATSGQGSLLATTDELEGCAPGRIGFKQQSGRFMFSRFDSGESGFSPIKIRSFGLKIMDRDLYR